MIIFEGIKGRPPKTDQELKGAACLDEGKAATMFEPGLILAGARGGHNGLLAFNRVRR